MILGPDGKPIRNGNTLGAIPEFVMAECLNHLAKRLAFARSMPVMLLGPDGRAVSTHANGIGTTIHIAKPKNWPRGGTHD